LFGQFAQVKTAPAQHRLGFKLVLLLAVLCLASLAAGSQGFSPREFWSLLSSPDAALLIGQIRAPRTLGAALVGALLGLAGATAQGLFRNPLADPYLLGSASGASLGVVLVLTASALLGQNISLISANMLLRLGLVGAAFIGAVLGVVLTLVLARGTQQTARLLLAGVIVGVVLSGMGDVLTHLAPDALRAKQSFLLGSTGFLGWSSCALLAAGLASTLPLTWRFSRALDALVLGEDSAVSLGLDLGKVRLWLVFAMALATAMAVSQSGLIAFVGLIAPHLVRRYAPSSHAYLVLASSLSGACLLLGADLLARTSMAPQELPVGVLTASLGGGYLLWQLFSR
jgi:iron complex transport system permease protein